MLQLAFAENGGDATVAKADIQLDSLFSDLKRERNETAAERLVNNILEAWYSFGSVSIDLMMLWSQQSVEAKKFDSTLDSLDLAITLQPQYAEDWNWRATLHFLI